MPNWKGNNLRLSAPDARDWGSDGTRTRDLRRDRPVMALSKTVVESGLASVAMRSFEWELGR